MSASSNAFAGVTSLTTTGTSWSPARCAARQRRSPAMSSKRTSRGSVAPPTLRTTIGWMIPFSRIDWASSSSSASSKCCRGCPGCGTILSTGHEKMALSPYDGLCGVAGFGGSAGRSASSPRPSARFFSTGGLRCRSLRGAGCPLEKLQRDRRDRRVHASKAMRLQLKRPGEARGSRARG